MDALIEEAVYDIVLPDYVVPLLLSRLCTWMITRHQPPCAGRTGRRLFSRVHVHGDPARGAR